MDDIFVTKIHINKVRHLENVDILLSETEKKHLILTGKNGSGKTSLLDAIRLCLNSNLLDPCQGSRELICKYEGLRINILYNNEVISNEPFNLILFYIKALKSLDMKQPFTVTKEADIIDTINSDGVIDTNTSVNFLQRMVNIYFMQALSEKKKDLERAQILDNWILNFTELLKKIYNCDELKLDFEDDKFKFNIIIPNREPFGLNEMSDGYASFLRIVIELINRMEAKTGIYCHYTMPGTVFIDEVETSLHVELQKQIMPFLTAMFPNIQFIVSTHSPFVISSISNAVVYDLEKKLRFEDLSLYSYEGIIEHYYEKDMYSDEAKKMFEEYKNLYERHANNELNEEETNRFADIIFELSAIPPTASKELIYEFLTMEKARKTKKDG